MSLVSTVVNKDQGDTLTYNLVQKFPLQMWKLRLKLPRDSHFHGKQTKNCFSLWVSLVCSTSFTRNLGYYTVKQIDFLYEQYDSMENYVNLVLEEMLNFIQCASTLSFYREKSERIEVTPRQRFDHNQGLWPISDLCFILMTGIIDVPCTLLSSEQFLYCISLWVRREKPFTALGWEAFFFVENVFKRFLYCVL